MTNVCAIIVTHNALTNNWLFNCLNSLIASTQQMEIIVVDNASQDETTSKIKALYPSVLLIENKENVGFGKANNQGFEVALKRGSEYFFMLNQDARIENNSVARLLEQLIQNPEFGIVSPMHYNGAGNALDLNFSVAISPRNCPNLYSDFVVGCVKNQIYDTDFVCAASWLVSKKSLELVGGFSPTFYHYGEDENFVHRLHFKGLKIGVYPHVRIFHDRENRPPATVTEKRRHQERKYVISRSDPNSNQSIIADIKTLKKARIKSLVRLDLQGFKIESQMLAERQKIKKIIVSNLNLSKSDEKYLFLNIL